MATSAQMAAYAEVLRTHTSALDKCVTEITIFKLKDPRSNATTTEFEEQILANTVKGKGIKRMAWGYSLDDPKTLVWMLDWAKIQDHWDFWQTPEFGPVMRSISNLFVEGRPLVRHYDFQPPGMLDQEILHVIVWDEGAPGKAEDDLRATVAPASDHGVIAKASKSAYAVDMDETTWCCTLLGFEDEAAARAAKVTPRGEAHVCRMKYLGPFNN
jgi:hypothetical protein